MKAQEAREQLEKLEVDRARALQEQMAANRAREAIAAQIKRYYTFDVDVPVQDLRRFIVEFGGYPDSDVVVQSGLYTLTAERLRTLTEIVEHIDHWKEGTIDSLAPSGIWTEVRLPKPICTCGRDYDGLPGTEDAGSERCPYVKHRSRKGEGT